MLPIQIRESSGNGCPLHVFNFLNIANNISLRFTVCQKVTITRIDNSTIITTQKNVKLYMINIYAEFAVIIQIKAGTVQGAGRATRLCSTQTQAILPNTGIYNCTHTLQQTLYTPGRARALEWIGRQFRENWKIFH